MSFSLDGSFHSLRDRSYNDSDVVAALYATKADRLSRVNSNDLYGELISPPKGEGLIIRSFPRSPLEEDVQDW